MSENSGYVNHGYQGNPYPPQQTQNAYPQVGQATVQNSQMVAHPSAPYPPQHSASGPFFPEKAGYVPQMQQGYYGSQGQAPSASTVQPSAPVQWDPAHAQQYQGDIGQEDVDENATAAEPQPGENPPSFESVVQGYESTAYGNEVLAGPPPSYEEATLEKARIDSAQMPSIDSEEAKEALLEYVSQQCCYGEGAAKKMDIKDIQSTSAFHYSLETFTESRSTKWHYTPYAGGFVDGPQNGPAPGPWEIPCQFTALFKNETQKLEVPHTASVTLCHVCHGCGFNRCWKCHGRGRVRCSWCHGSGRRSEMREGQTHNVCCSSCGGSGRKRCITCHGNGCIQCRECRGFGKIKQFIQLTVKFENRLSDHIVERTDMPDHLIRDVAGDVIFEQIALRVGPVENFIEQEINSRAADIVSNHSVMWPNDRILQQVEQDVCFVTKQNPSTATFISQRQKLRSVPVYECKFKYKDEEGRFWVYGKQRAVYTQDYPHTCLCCTIL